jgi:hypothetical protein
MVDRQRSNSIAADAKLAQDGVVKKCDSCCWGEMKLDAEFRRALIVVFSAFEGE